MAAKKAKASSVFETAEVLLDTYGRPVFVLPQDLPEGDCTIRPDEGVLEFFVGNQKVGNIRDVPDELVTLVAVQESVGMIVWADESKACPDSLTHVATVNAQHLAGGAA